METYQKQLLEEGLISKDQEDFITQIEDEKIISVFYETRSLLYLGVLLLTSGIGLLIYQNLGQIAHLALMTILIILEGVCWWYIIKNQPAYSNKEISAPTPYFDYVLLLAALLIVSIFSYGMIQFNLLEVFLQWSSLISAIVFLYLSFRYDHKGVLTLSITAFCAFWGLTISPINWVSFDFDNYRSLYLSGTLIGIALIGTGFLLERKNIKKHFKFTFQNLGLLIFYMGILNAQIESNQWWIFSLIGIFSSLGVAIYFWKHTDCLLFIYGAIGGYFSFTRMIAETGISNEFEFWLIYTLFSMVGFIVLIQQIISAQRKNKANDRI